MFKRKEIKFNLKREKKVVQKEEGMSIIKQMKMTQ
jgi:hypothetical protein